jgi:dTDP-4-amino-4,6-dideoxygalactose transaminase
MLRKIPLARPTIGEPELEAQARALRSGRLVLGPENLAFEAAIAAHADVGHAISVASGTAALVAALWALELPPGGEVLVPAFTFPAPAHAVAALGLVPIAVDVDADSWNLSPTETARHLGKKTCAILAVDQFGLCADYHALARLAAQAGVPIVEDAACAIGSRDPDGKRAGSFGALGCFSFHPRKIVTTGEGGAVVSADARVAERVRRLRHHGQSAPGTFVEVGLNFRLAEPAAAVGVAQLERLDALLAERRERVAAYRMALADTPVTRGLAMQADAPMRSWQTLAVVLPEGVERARVVAQMAERGVESGAATYALHRVGSLTGRLGGEASAASLPQAERLHERALALPLFGGLSDDEIAQVVAALAEALS